MKSKRQNEKDKAMRNLICRILKSNATNEIMGIVIGGAILGVVTVAVKIVAGM